MADNGSTPTAVCPTPTYLEGIIAKGPGNGGRQPTAGRMCEQSVEVVQRMEALDRVCADALME